ncbi:MAG: CHRD domain-containing protein [Verrucomicrobiales bacterium]|nr:CHRD domain-containing protein [Verrucomicrobiales bacterium]
MHIPHPYIRRRKLLSAATAAITASAAFGQVLLYQEGFNDDGEAANPQRFTSVGRDIFEVPRIQSELGNYDQKGPLYFGLSSAVSYAGVPAIPARRMIYTWRGTDASGATEDLLALFDSSVNWLLNGKKNATVVIQPNAASCQALADRLTALGHTVVDDDIAGTPDEQDVVGDLFIHGPGASNPSRFVLVPKPVIVINDPDYDDMLVGSIGTAATFAPGKVTIAAAGHPAAGGKTGSFDAFIGDQAFSLVGSFLPPGVTTLATVTRVVPPSVGSLADVDAMIAGTKSHDEAAGTVTEFDISDASAGSWTSDNAVPGGYAGVWGLRGLGKLNVSAAGTYRFALGSDDGARLSIDLGKDGLTAADVITEDPGPHAHQTVYANVTFPSSGAYDFEVRSYNSGGGGSVELSVATQAGDIPDDALDSGYWELVGTSGATSPVTLSGIVSLTAYVATGPNVEVQAPLIVLLNGPGDSPAGTFYDGGPFSGYEGSAFFGASGLNKWAYPDGQSYRSVQLKPVNVAGKPNLKLTIALAATVVDFETSDFIDVLVYPTGANSTPVTLAHFQGVQNAIQPWMADQKDNFVRRLTKQFTDFTYDLPANSTDLIVEIRVATTWWTEIAAFDNIRITSTPLSEPLGSISATTSGDDVNLSWVGGTPPFLVQGKLSLNDANWIDLVTVSGNSAKIPMAPPGGAFRVQDATTKTVKLFKSVMNGANERPTPVNEPGTGLGLLALDGLTATYVVSYQDLTGPAVAYHLHGLGNANQAAGVKFNLVPAGDLGKRGLFAGKATVDQATADGIVQGLTYFNLHTAAHGSGEIRGQVLAVP